MERHGPFIIKHESEWESQRVAAIQAMSVVMGPGQFTLTQIQATVPQHFHLWIEALMGLGHPVNKEIRGLAGVGDYYGSVLPPRSATTFSSGGINITIETPE